MTRGQFCIEEVRVLAISSTVFCAYVRIRNVSGRLHQKTKVFRNLLGKGFELPTRQRSIEVPIKPHRSQQRIRRICSKPLLGKTA